MTNQIEMQFNIRSVKKGTKRENYGKKGNLFQRIKQTK